MKKLLLISLIFFSGGYFLPVVISENGVGNGGNKVTCYSESRAKSGYTYYDCGDCCKQFNSKGYGSTSTCNTSSCNAN